MKKLLQVLLCLPVIGFGQNWNNDWDTDWSIFGWSKSGYVALFESHGYDLIGGCRYRLIIQNLKTDQIEDELILLDIEGDSDLCDSLTLLIKFDSEIDRLLAKYDLVLDTPVLTVLFCADHSGVYFLKKCIGTAEKANGLK